MTVGDKIKIIRTFRGMTQKQLAMAAGLGNKGADNRIAQYEINYRAPKKELLDQMSKALHVNPQTSTTMLLAPWKRFSIVCYGWKKNSLVFSICFRCIGILIPNTRSRVSRQR